MQSLQQLRAKNAFGFIQSTMENNNSLDIKGMATKLPVMFQKNGLLATWAYLLAGKNKYNSLLKNLIDHLSGVFGQKIISNLSQKKLFNTWTDESQSSIEMMEITDELIKYSVWLKRAAEAYSSDKKPGDEND